MSENDAEKAWQAWQLEILDHRHTLGAHDCFMAGRASRDAEIDDLRTENRKLLVDGEPHRRQNRRLKHFIAETERLRRQLAEAQATIDKVLAVTDDMRSSGWHIGKTVPGLGEKIYRILSAPSSTGGNDHE